MDRQVGPESERLTRVQARGLGPSVLIVAGLLAVVAAFALGFRLGDEGRSPAPIASPSLRSPATPEPFVRVDTVDESLQQAYDSAGAGDVSFCTTDAAPRCERQGGLALQPSDQIPDVPDAATWDTLSPWRTTAHRVVFVTDLAAEEMEALLVTVDAGGPGTGVRVPIADPGQQGVRYADLGTLRSGRYLVVVRALVLGGAVFEGTYRWEAAVVALEVQEAGTGTAAGT